MSYQFFFSLHKEETSPLKMSPSNSEEEFFVKNFLLFFISSI